jgi:hypothetical protein
MKRKILTLIMLFAVTVAFAQVPKHLRVLNYVPDSCYSLTLLNLDTLAKVSELESLHMEKVLKPLYDSMSFSKKLVQSWIKRDNKTGIDFTATAAFVNSRYYLLPLNNEKNFEKMVRSIDKSFPPFETMTDPDGRKIRCMTIETKYGMNFAVICTEDVACIVTLTYMDAVFNSVPSEEVKDTFNVDTWFNSVIVQESPMQVWERLSHSKFASSETATNMLAKGWDSYTGYKQGSSILRTMSGVMSEMVPASMTLQNAINQINMEIFSKGEVRHDNISSYSEFHNNNQSGVQTMKSSPEELKKLLPYISGDYTMLFICTMENYGGAAKPYTNALRQWGELSQLLNKPFVFTVSSLVENNIMFSTIVEKPEEVRGILERYVETCNHITDSVRKNVPIVEVVEEPLEEPLIQEEVSEKPEAQPENEEPVEYNEYHVELIEPISYAEIPEDSTINMKTLVYKKIDGWDTYIILTNKKEMDYETFTQKVKEDSSCVLVKDDLLFFTKSLSALKSLSQPMEHEWPKEYFEHNFYARADLSSLVHLIGMDATLPLRDVVCYVDNNTFTLNLNAEPGLRHGILYEMVKFTIDILQRLD